MFAHNFKGYDGHFVVEGLKKMGITPSEMYTAGTEITYMAFTSNDGREEIKFKDSLCFIPMALAKFSKTFGIPEEKGFYPYLFNSRSYVPTFCSLRE